VSSRQIDPFELWLKENCNRVPDSALGEEPIVLTIDVTKVPLKIPLVYATTAKGMTTLRKHNAEVGVFET
jgi:hypothetical protein